MHSEMNGQGHEGIPGAQQLTSPEGRINRQARILVGAFTGAPPAVPSCEAVVLSRDVEVVVAPELVADLYHPSLVISPDYVGPDRRGTDPSMPSNAGPPGFLRRVIQVVVMTTLVVVPMTMISSRSVPPAATGSPSVQGQIPAKVGNTSGPGSQPHSPHVFTASPQQIARAEAAYQRALARVEASGGAVVSPTTSKAVAGSGVALTSGQTGVVQSVAPVVSGQEDAAAGAAARQRAVTHSQAAQERATNQALAVQLRAQRAAFRAASQAHRTATQSAADNGAHDGSTSAGVQTAA